MNVEPGDDGSHSRTVKRAVYGVGLPAGALMILLLLYFERAQGTLHIVDRIGLPLLSVLVAGIWLCFKMRWGSFRVLEGLLFSGVFLMIFASLSYSAFQISGTDLVNLTGLGYWTPVLYALAFLIFGVRTGRNISLTLYTLILGVWLAEVLLSRSDAIVERSILFQLFASNALLLLLLYGFGILVNLQAQQAARYAHDAHTDALTGLPNRRALGERLRRELERVNRYERTFSVVLLDIDHFKNVNDLYGHQLGDRVLKVVGELLGVHLRNVDTAGRWGGEEFLLLLPELPLGPAHEVTERFRQCLETHTFPHGEPLTASFGVAEVKPGESLESLLARADQALYEAKAQGRNRVMPAIPLASEWAAVTVQAS